MCVAFITGLLWPRAIDRGARQRRAQQIGETHHEIDVLQCQLCRESDVGPIVCNAGSNAGGRRPDATEVQYSHVLDSHSNSLTFMAEFAPKFYLSVGLDVLLNEFAH